MLKIEPLKSCGFAVKGNVAVQAYFHMAVLALDCYIIIVAALAHFSVDHAERIRSLQDL